MLDQFLLWFVLVVPVLLGVVLLVVPAKQENPKSHMRWRYILGTALIVYGIVVWWQVSRSARAAEVDRAKAVTETSNEVSASVSESVSKSVAKSVGDQYAMTINQLQLQIGSLQGKLDAQGKNVDVIKGSNIVSGNRPIPVQIMNLAGVPPDSQPDIHVSRIPTTPNPKYGHNAVQFIVSTNRIMNGGKARVTCKNKINQGTAMLGNTSIVTTGPGGLLDEHTYQSPIESPNWAPDAPLVVTLYFDEDDLGVCSVTPLS